MLNLSIEDRNVVFTGSFCLNPLSFFKNRFFTNQLMEYEYWGLQVDDVSVTLTGIHGLVQSVFIQLQFEKTKNQTDQVYWIV